MSNPDTATSVRWVDCDASFHVLRLGRIEIAQISQSAATGHWFYTLRFAEPGERASFSCATQDEAKAVYEAHARKVVS